MMSDPDTTADEFPPERLAVASGKLRRLASQVTLGRTERSTPLVSGGGRRRAHKRYRISG